MENKIIILGVFVLAASLLSGLCFIRLGARLSAGFWPSWTDAAKAALWSMVATSPISVLASSPAIDSKPIALLFFYPAILVIGSWVIGRTIKHPDTGRIGTKRGAIVSLVWAIGGTVAAFVIGIVVTLAITYRENPVSELPATSEFDSPTATIVEPTNTEPQSAGPQMDALRNHYNAIYAAHPDADSIVESIEFAEWRMGKSPQDQDSISRALNSGTTSQIIEMFNSYKGDLHSNVQPKAVERSRPASPGAGDDTNAMNRVKQLYPYINDTMTHGDRWSGPFKAWRREFLAHGYRDADIEAAKTVDRYRLDGFGSCYPVPGTTERGRCN